MKIVELEIKDIEIPQGLLPRVLTGTVEEKVEEYKELIEEGVEFDPILVWERNDGRYWVIDGVHRIEAHKRAGKQFIKAKLVKCKDELDYRIKAIQANLKHGLALAKGERPLLAQTLYKQGLSEEEIRKVFGVSERTVREWLKTVKEEEKQAKIKKALELREKGYSLREIAKEIGITPEGVRKLLSTSGKDFQKLTLLTPSGDPTPEGLRLWSEYVEQSDTEKEDLFNPERFSEFIKNKGYLVQRQENVKINGVYYSNAGEPAFLALLEHLIKSHIKVLVDTGMSETAIKASISKEKSWIFKHLSSTAKAKLAGLLSDYIQEQIQKREERQKEEELIIETAKEILQNPEFIFSSWTNLGKEVLKRLEEKGNYLRHKYHEGHVSEILQKHSNTLLDIYKQIPEISEDEIKEIIEDFDLEEFESLEQFKETLKAQIIQEGKRPAGVNILTAKVWNEYYSQKIKQQEKAPPSPPPATDLEDSTVESSLSNETEEELSEEEYIKKLEESWERAHSQTEEEKAKTGPKGPHKHKSSDEKPQTPEEILNDAIHQIQAYTLLIVSKFGRKKALEVLDELLNDLETLSFNQLRQKWTFGYAMAVHRLGIETYEYWREEV